MRVAPEGGESLARPTGTTPTSGAPQQPPSRPGAPRQAPQPPQLPPIDIDRLIPTAITSASLGRLATDRLEQLRTRRGTELEARQRLEAERVFNERLQRAVAQGRLQDIPQVDQDWLAADPTGRRLRLAFDPDEGDFRINEARAAVEAEETGVVPGNVERAYDESGRSQGADFVDADGRLWDIKEARAGASQIVRAASSMDVSPENILVDARGLTAAERQALRDEINRRTLPPGSGEIRFMPEN